jgi:hypothetical protein
MDNGLHEDFELIFNSETSSADIFSHKAENLVSGRSYRFYVTAINRVGSSPNSDVVSIYACSNPSEISAPTLAGQQSSVKVPLEWIAPANSGGCSITSYSILLSDKSEGSFLQIHVLEVNNKPTLRYFEVTELLSTQFQYFKIEVTNKGGYSS